jgi:tetratricopeptide (TPR) repeat protein
MAGDFQGNGRFRILRRVGAGGMGVVYEAFDNQRHMRVALKTLPLIVPKALYLFKNEFRALAGVSHPNLVTLFELLNEGDDWFFTMQYVEGLNFREYVRAASVGERAAEMATATGTNTVTLLLAPEPDARECDYRRLREAFSQVVGGLTALHAQGKVHRDIKPSNVLVTHEGRAMILDFGLVQDFEQADPHMTSAFAGSAAYMSPEQAAGLTLTAKTDWYSAGVMLYECLTGKLPHLGSVQEIISQKQSMRPSAPIGIAPGVPEDLNDLCMALLELDPGRRPEAAEILDRLNASAAAGRPAPAAVHESGEKRLFVGRQAELAALDEAFQKTRSGQAAVVSVEGESGVGKSTLLKECLDRLQEKEGAAVLTGRCYEQESVPYKALDALIDALTSYLRRLPRLESAALMPRDAALLVELFPVMGRLPAVTSARARFSSALERHEIRRRAFQAVRELLSRLGDHVPLVLAIDDLQWGDRDSADLLAEILRQPDGPVLLLIVAYRGEYLERSQGLRVLLSTIESQQVARFSVQLAPLGGEETHELAERLLSGSGIENADLVNSIARESQGNAYFVRELVQNATEERLTGGIQLGSVILDRVASLPDAPKALLETIAVAAQPLKHAVAYLAAGMQAIDPAAMELLRSMRLVRTSGNSLDDDVEAYHDRIRESVAGSLAQEQLRERHRALAEAFEESQSGEPESVAVHLELGGKPERARTYYRRAAEAASAALAFDKAVNLYTRALDLADQNSKDWPELCERLADAQANAGFSLEAARRYQKLLGLPGFENRSDLAREAAYQFCICGHAREGTEAFQQVLRRAGLRMPRGALVAVAGRVALLIWIRVRGDRLSKPRSGADSERELEAIDVAQFMSLGLSVINPYAGTYFSALSVALALRAGEPGRALKALAWEAVVTAAFSGGRKRAEQLLARCDEIIGTCDTALNRAFLKMARAMVIYELGQWAEAKRLLEEADTALSECSGVNFELNATRTYLLWDLVSLGNCAQLAAVSPIWFRDALNRGDAFTAANVGGQPYVLGLLGQDDPARAAAIHEQAMSLWPAQEYTLQKMMAALGRGWIDLYIDDAEAAWRAANDHWKRARRVFLHLLENIPAYMLQWRGLSALAMAEKARREGADEREFLRAAERDAAVLRGLTLAHGPAMGEAILAGVAQFRGDRNQAMAHLESAARTFEALSMLTLTEIARRELGRLRGGEEGAALAANAEEKLRSYGVRNLDAMRRLWLRGAGIL